MACTPERSIALGELAAGRLDEAEVLAVLEHVEGCPSCSEELDLVARMVAGAAAGAASGRVPRRPRPLGRLLRWAPVAAAAAALVASLPWLVRPGGGGPADPRALASLDALPIRATTLRGPGANPDLARAVERLAAGETDAAMRELERLRASLAPDAPERPLADLYLGLAAVRAGALERALAPLEAAAKDGVGLVRERALWYLANARLALADVDGAEADLRRLEALGGDYAPNAREKLAAIAAWRSR